MKNNFIRLIVITIIFGTLSFISIVPKNSQENEKEKVESILKLYRDAIQNLTVENTSELFTSDSQIFESGGSEGSYQVYKEHHLGPELKYFKSFKFSDYKIDIKVDLPYAFANESYIYKIVIPANREKGRKERTIAQKGVATIVLKKIQGSWKITSYHSSSKDVNPDTH